MTHNVDQHVHLPDPPQRPFTVWPANLRERLKELWETNSSSEIVEIFKAEGLNFTRNSIVGVLKRMGLNKKNKTRFHPSTKNAYLTFDKPASTYKRKPKPIAAPEIIPAAIHCAEIIPLRKTLDDLDQATECHYIAGDGPIYFFCARPIAQGSYCRLHYDLTHQQPSAPQLKPARRA